MRNSIYHTIESGERLPNSLPTSLLNPLDLRGENRISASERPWNSLPLLLSLLLLGLAAFYFLYSEVRQNGSLAGLDYRLGKTERRTAELTRKTEDILAVLAHSRDTDAQLADLSRQILTKDRAVRQLAERVRTLEIERIAKGSVDPDSAANREPRELSRNETSEGTTTAFPAAGSHPSANVTTVVVSDGVSRSIVTQPNIAKSCDSEHKHKIKLGIPLASGASLHVNTMNEGDYWNVIRDVQPGRRVLVRVLPFALIDAGVKVHSIDDGCDYLLTAASMMLQP